MRFQARFPFSAILLIAFASVERVRSLLSRANFWWRQVSMGGEGASTLGCPGLVMTTAAESRREAARGNGTTGGQFGFQDHTPPAAEPPAAWPGTNRNVRDLDFVPASAADWPGFYGTEGQGSVRVRRGTLVPHYAGADYGVPRPTRSAL